jgi:nucleoid-associated protein YgaU
MNRHAGASFTLSVLVVAFFAVALYQPEHPPSPATASVAVHEAAADLPPQTSRSVPTVTPGVPLEQVTAEPRRPLETAAAVPAQFSPLPSTRRVRTGANLRSGRPIMSSSLIAEASPSIARAEDPQSPRQPLRPLRTVAGQAGFTAVAAGESLSDIAVRVYGTPDAAQTLWLANRDILSDDAPLRQGMLLRTP